MIITRTYLRKLIREEIESKDLEPIFDKDWVIKQVTSEISKFPELPGAGLGAIFSRADKEMNAHVLNLRVDDVPLNQKNQDARPWRNNILKIVDSLVEDGMLTSHLENGREWISFSDSYLDNQIKDFNLD